MRAARAGTDRRAPGVAVFGAAVVFCYLGVTTEFAQPYLDRVTASIYRGAMPYNQAIQIGLFGVMLQSALLVGLVLKLWERFELPFGSLTLIVGLQAFMIVAAARGIDFMVLVAVLGGLAGDLWLLVLRQRPGAFAFAFPATLYAIYVLALLLAYGTWWEVHAVTGIVGAAGLTGWLVSFVMRCPSSVASASATPA